ncbi:3-isopropylmalate dehydratase small subunit [Pandoraea pnomenusa]|uniref:3-isopropylmalate dehydratase small subunit n=1 Tax=Pandoraea pnomenusa TaxID=93220 RepID=UPI00333F6CE3
MQSFSRHVGLAVPLDRDNVDTDAIMPKQFMKAIARTGFGPYVFDEWRFKDPGYFGKPPETRVPNPECPLNFPRYKGASILVAGRNFGCGSSREHAPWALQQAGFRVLIAKSFGDIFLNNCYKIGLLPVALPEADVTALLSTVASSPGCKLTVDLPSQTVIGASGETLKFETEETQKARLLTGADEVAITLQRSDEVAQFETRHLKARPWI